jgi:hypothetical protein
MPFTDAMIRSVLHGDAFREPLTIAVTALAAVVVLLNVRLATSHATIPRRLFIAEWLLVAVCVGYWLLPPTPAHAWVVPLTIATWAAVALHVLPRFVSAAPADRVPSQVTLDGQR